MIYSSYPPQNEECEVLWIGSVWAFASVRDENHSAHEAELVFAHACMPTSYPLMDQEVF